jgi:cytidylate kinase
MIIAITGKAGSGKGTIARGLIEKLGNGYRHISVGDMKRELATQMGLTIFQFDEMGNTPENKEKFDLQYEEFQKNLDVNDNIILDSRLSFYCQPKAFKVFLTISDEEAARRIFNDKNRAADTYASEAEVLEITNKRDAEYTQRFKDLYGIDIKDMSQFDLVVDTTENNPQKYIDLIAEKFEEWKMNSGK